MAARDNFEGRVFGNLRAAIIVRASQVRQRCQDIQLRERERRPTQPLGCDRRHLAQFDEQLVLERLGLVIRTKNFFLVLF